MKAIATRRGVRMLLGGGVLALLAQFPVQAAAQNCIQDVSPTGPSARVLPAERCGISFDLGVPAGCSSRQACGLIVELPGVTLSAAIQERNTRIRDLGMQTGFVVATATANPGIGGLPSFVPGDARFVEAFLREAIRKFGIDTKRVHLTGFSQGAALSLNLACDLRNLIASVAVLAPAGGVPASCSNSGLPVSGVLLAQSSLDQLVPPLSTLGTGEAFAKGMGLDFENDAMLVDGTQEAFVERFVSDRRPQTLELLLFNTGGATIGDGHCFPGSFEPAQPLRNLPQAVRDAALQLFRMTFAVRMGANGMNLVVPMAPPMMPPGAAAPGAAPTDPNLAMLMAILNNPEMARDFVQGLQFGCNDSKQLRFGEQAVRFFLQNPKR